MKRLYITIMVAALLSACGHRASKAGTVSAEDSTAIESAEQTTEGVFATDSIGVEREDTIASVKVSADWPVSGPQALVNSIRQYICNELSSNPMQEEKTKVKLYDNGKTAVESCVEKQYQELFKQKQEGFESGFGYGMPYTYWQRIFKMEESDSYVTYLSNTEGFLGGAHGFATSTGITFRKSDGKQLGYHSEYNKAKEVFEIKDQTLFSNPDSPQLAALLKEGVKSYFQEFDQEVTTDQQLKDMLMGVDDVNRIPLPNNPPLFTKNGLCFTYQQYEIAAYAAGMINFDISYDKIRPYLTKEAAEVIK